MTYTNFSPKPAYDAYKTLTQIRPDDSTVADTANWRSTDKKLYSPSWKRPDGKKVWALWWTGDSPQSYAVTTTGTIESISDYLGQPLNVEKTSTVTITLDGKDIYIVGPTTLQLTKVPTRARHLQLSTVASPRLLSMQTTHDQLVFRFDRDVPQQSVMELYTVDGRQIFSQKVSSSSRQIIISVRANISKGTYCSRIRIGDCVQSQRWVLID